MNVHDDGFVSAGSLSLGVFASGQGIVNVSGTGSVLEVTNSQTQGITVGEVGSGVLNVSNGGRLTVSGTNILGARGEINIGAGGTATLQSKLSSAGKLVVNGVLHSDVEAHSTTSHVSGGGAINGTLQIGSGAVLAPGNSVGTLSATSAIFASGGIYELQVNDANGIGGGPFGWDKLSLSDSLSITATSSDRFVIRLQSLDGMNVLGEALNFDATQNYSWTFVSAVNGISGFDASAFTLDTSSFSNDLLGGSFSIVNDGNRLAVNFSAVPEPTSLVFVGMGACVLFLRRPKRQLTKRLLGHEFAA